MQKFTEAPTYIDKVKVVLFSNVEDLFQKEKAALLTSGMAVDPANRTCDSLVQRSYTYKGEVAAKREMAESVGARASSTSAQRAAVELDQDSSVPDEHVQARSKIQTGMKKRTFLREVRLRKSIETSKKPKKNRSSFWQSVLDKAQTSNEKKGKTEKTDVSVELGGWINLPYGIHTTLALVVEYFDGDTHCSFKVDSCESKGAIQVLLSGSCDVIADCPVETVKLYCYGIEDKSVWIENLSFECKE